MIVWVVGQHESHFPCRLRTLQWGQGMVDSLFVFCFCFSGNCHIFLLFPPPPPRPPPFVDRRWGVGNNRWCCQRFNPVCLHSGIRVLCPCCQGRQFTHRARRARSPSDVGCSPALPPFRLACARNAEACLAEKSSSLHRSLRVDRL